MAGVGEASAIVGLISTAAQLSKAVIDIASRYKGAGKQIESFGLEVATLGTILDQLSRLQSKEDSARDSGAHDVTLSVVAQCSDLFSELDAYKDTLYNGPGSIKSLTFWGKTKWVFGETELAYLKARVDSMKINMLLMMTMQCTYTCKRSAEPETNPVGQENMIEVQRLSLQSSACVRRLEGLEREMLVDSGTDAPLNRMSIQIIDTSRDARSTRESILSMYGNLSYPERILSLREDEFTEPVEDFLDQARASRIIEAGIEDPGLTRQPGTLHRRPYDKSEPFEKYAAALFSGPDDFESAVPDMDQQSPDTAAINTETSDEMCAWCVHEHYAVNHAITHPDFPFRAKALFSYEPVPDSVYENAEMSFSEGDILEIVAPCGDWWQAVGEDKIYFVPSNYLTVLW